MAEGDNKIIQSETNKNMEDSDDCSDDSKRKRDPDDATQRSKNRKLSQIPSKTNSKEQKLDLLIEMVSELKKQSDKTSEDIKMIREENKMLRQENQKLKEENKDIKEKLEETNDRIEWLEREKRKNNIVMSGIEIETENKTELKQFVENIIKNTIQININVKTAHKIGRKVCLIEINNEDEKEQIMKNKYKLKELQQEKVYINHDMTTKEREKNKQIRKMAKEEELKGNKVKIGYNKINKWRDMEME
ncbi:calcium-binding and coiled-coil domain-containing protein 2-like [Diabrotica virgifera virgifera]|uniref:Uncharacterized protein n=1 Tax=Diabrotica virgifera virgifera TaxID=50390 RepID=A0ABM5L1N9_DIAVI|nr:calcium-binding and coiled-coil domain-containing protein 2-like [Diabrotica virgifera virgifera]